MLKRTTCDPIVTVVVVVLIIAVFAVSWPAMFPRSPDSESVAAARAAGSFPKTASPIKTGPSSEDVARILGDDPDVSERVTD